MKTYLFVVAVALCSGPVLIAQTPATSQTPPPAAGAQTDPNERYRIGFQDTLDVQIFRHPELNRRVNVNPNGTINLFRLDQPIVAVCKTETELAKDIASAYEKDYLRNPEVSVIAVEQKSQAVAVIGAVQKAGSFYLNRRVQLLELLAFAGGPDTQHAGSRLLVYRPGSTSNCKMNEVQTAENENIQLMDFRLRDVQQGKQTLWMRPGDVVSVLDADQVFVYGNVNKQQAVKMQEPLTLTRAIVLAEGLRPATDTGNIRILRQKPGSADREELSFNFKEIVKGNKPDPFLEPNDIIAVSQDKMQSIVNTIGKSITNGIPSIFYRIP